MPTVTSIVGDESSINSATWSSQTVTSSTSDGNGSSFAMTLGGLAVMLTLPSLDAPGDKAKWDETDAVAIW